MIEDVPYAPEAEQSLLGSLMLDPGAIDQVGALDPLDMYHGGHQEILRHILRLLSAGKTADMISVLTSLEAAGRDEYVGGLSYLGQIANNTPSASMAARYADIVREKAALRRLMSAGGEIQALTAARDGMSVADKVQRAQSIIMDLSEKAGSDSAPKMMADILPRWMDRLDERMNRKDGTFAGTPTGIIEIDKRFRGLEDGRLYIIAARPGMGKTTLELNIAEHIGCNLGKPVLLCSQEMPDVELAQCLVASLARIDKERLDDGRLTDEEFDRLSYATQRLSSSKIMIDEQSGLTMANVKTKARQAQRQMGKLGMIGIDYLQLMVGEGSNQNEKIGEISRSCKELAREFSCPVLLLSQLNRECEKRPDKRPVPSDLRDSGSIEQDADVIWFVYRDELYHPESLDKGLAELICAKHRMGSQNGKTTPLAFHGEFGRFESISGGLPSWNAPKPEKKRRGFGD